MLIRIFIAALVFVGPGLAAQADVINYNFDDGTDQGWTNVLTSPDDEPIAYEASDRTDASAPGHSGSFRVLPKISGTFSPTEDSPHKTLVFRSPEFVANADASINFFMSIGAGGAATPGPDFNSLPPNSASNGFVGLCVRRVSDGAYVLVARRSANNGSWEEFTFDSTTLSANSLIGETLTLDVIDQHNGGFGWVALDTVTLNNVTSSSEPSILGDANGDGNFDFGDIEAFFLAVTDLPAYLAQYPGVAILTLDMNDDGNTDFGDIEAFFTALTSV